MSKKVSTQETLIYNLEVDITEDTIVSKTVEECHGLHEFTDIEVQSIEVNKVVIVIDDDTKIDITDRLTNEEKEILSDY
jgi:hypothetical protein